MFLLNGKPIDINSQLTIDGIQYPAGYFTSFIRRTRVGIVEVPDPVKPDERYNFVTRNPDGTYTSIPKPASMLKAEKLREINAAFTAALDQYAAEYPKYEQLTWHQQKEEAAAWVAWDDNGRVGQEPATPKLNGIALNRGVAREVLIRKAHAKALLFDAVSEVAIGKRQRLEDAILAIPDDAPAELLKDIRWDEE